MRTNITSGQDLAAAQQRLSQAQTKKNTAAVKQPNAQSLFNSTPHYIEQAKEQTTRDLIGSITKETIVEEILNPAWQEALNALNEANDELSGAEEEVSVAEEEVSKAEEAAEEEKEETKSQFDDSSSTTDSEVHYETVDGISPKKTPDAYAQEYADENNMTLDEAKEVLKGKYGEPDYDKNSDKIPPQGDPDTYAREYADKNGITLEEAREELKAKYGDPAAKDSSVSDATSDAIPEGVDPDEYAQEYADENGMTFEEAKEVLKGKYGEPKYDENRNSDSTEELTEQEQELQGKGIPVEIIKQGDDAIRKYAKDHNIELKKPE